MDEKNEFNLVKLAMEAVSSRRPDLGTAKFEQHDYQKMRSLRAYLWERIVASEYNDYAAILVHSMIDDYLMAAPVADISAEIIEHLKQEGKDK